MRRLLARSAAITLSLAGPTLASGDPPTITSGSFSDHRVTIAWSSVSQRDAYDVRYSEGPPGAIPTWQTEVTGGTGGSFTFLPPDPGVTPAAARATTFPQGTPVLARSPARSAR